MSELRFEIPGLGPSAVEYLAAWELQRDVHARVVAGEPDTVLLLEHPPVFTAGKRTEPHERPFDGTPVIDVDRGGKITFHGPGQLVGYPIVRLPDHVKVVDYVRRIEEALIAVCADLGVATARVPGRSGVWIDDAHSPPRQRGGATDTLAESAQRQRGGATDTLAESAQRQRGGAADTLAQSAQRKIAAIGIRVSQGVAMHGFALNCDVDLAWYDRFVPCGISDAGVTSLSAELGRDVTVEEVLPSVQRHLTELLGWGPYERTPDHEPRSEAALVPALRVPVVNPSS
ncbi:lipoyl(octanoyl) transferase LipB [Nocardioides caldifontis]|uniref:lipoyl(octanoyl) transferase LipB n=1 Tax=Nocardioides caldifontis TaxID=2588938 RepID=UPI0011DFC408|nr:lipoyl(octanoyl) transferase LipB [Nocardioides caldifontis]